MTHRVVVGLTGSSGALFTVRFLEETARQGIEAYLIYSRWGLEVLKEETGMELTDIREMAKRVFPDDDLSAPFSSGSVRYDALVVIPCSMTTLARIAGGLADTLIARCAHVALKERRKLILCIRETPLSLVNLENMVRVTRAGGVIMPMTLSFYLGEDLDDLVSVFARRVLNVIGIPQPDLWRSDDL